MGLIEENNTKKAIMLGRTVLAVVFLKGVKRRRRTKNMKKAKFLMILLKFSRPRRRMEAVIPKPSHMNRNTVL